MIRLVASAWPERSDALDPGDCVHVRLTLEVGDQTLVRDDACVRDWFFLVARVLEGLLDGDASVPGLVQVAAGRAHVRLASGGPHLVCDPHELEAALEDFVRATESTITRTYAGGAAWCADARERAVRARSELAP